MPLTKVLIANRGEIACRVIRTLRRLGIKSVAVYSEADRHAAHVFAADESVCVGPPPARQSYLDSERILEAARQLGVDGIHPGYGFLSENADFAEACERAGIAFIGPTPGQIRSFGLKHTSREIARTENVPLLPGSPLLESLEAAQAEASRIGFPVMLKSTAGGGGIGMQLCGSPAELAAKYETVRSLGRNNFKDDGIYLEKFVEIARHVEVQIFGDGKGNVVALGERDCSTQRRNQKVIEETPAPGLTSAIREQLSAAAVKLGRAVNYRSAGTVEFVYDTRAGQFYFLEVNTRLQVEHGVTEMVTGLDLVEWMIRVAAGEPPDLGGYHHSARGHSIQVRIYAEDPGKDFLPSSGILTEAEFPTGEGIRCDHWIAPGAEISPYYDPLLGKLLVHAPTRERAITRMLDALAATRLAGFETNLDYLAQIIASPAFRTGDVFTGFLRTFDYQPRTVEVLDSGTQTTIQDYPGRLGYWAVGVPPSGPMDALAFRLGNQLLGNPEDAAGLEITLTGPTLRFNTGARICLTGAHMTATLDGVRLPYWSVIQVTAGQTLAITAVEGDGCRAYLSVAGGWDVPIYLGSTATFTLGGFGGHAGRALRVGDILKLKEPGKESPAGNLPEEGRPTYHTAWEIGVLYGPHGAPDFFTPEDVEMFFSTSWKVHYNSARTGVRLVGPKPRWARSDGGEAGLHPSNIHDNAYAIGAIDFTGDMPIILGPDGPSLGGFVCLACIVHAELWKVGQLRPGSTVRFRPMRHEEAVVLELAQDKAIAELGPLPLPTLNADKPPEEVSVLRLAATDETPEVVCRAAGDRYLLIEFGAMLLDLDLRFCVHALMLWLQKSEVAGVIDLTPGIRSLQVHYDSRRLKRGDLLALIRGAHKGLRGVADLEVPSRIVHLPLSWDDPATQLAIEKYSTGVRPDAPWCPSNIEFIRRINGLDSIEAVKEVVFGANYLVLGLGDVYLGAPVATPVDPRHRLVTTKYNPARTWTPENAVGIGGAYLCVYGMEGPGGYQFVGRTIQMWNRFRTTADFAPGTPWLLRFFDQLHFYPVSGEELLRLRDEFAQGRWKLRVEETTFRLREYHDFLASIKTEAAEFKLHQHAAFEAERERWAAAGLDVLPSESDADAAAPDPTELPEGMLAARASLPANVWQVLAKPGDEVQRGDRLVILEAMKMEIPVFAPETGIVHEVLCTPGMLVAPGQTLCILQQGAKASTTASITAATAS